jgi:hypothetical protein
MMVRQSGRKALARKKQVKAMGLTQRVAAAG